ncbi:MAG: hypothetical protein KF757_03355 [Phycisphaeraceae bacterium]|nr:hypothetical protein [Phycisphaeraceae bacterium]MCW5763042.1 hypothetical protein [Phycisphaeraceae bacterium]
MTDMSVDQRRRKWIQVLHRACEVARDLLATPEGQAAIDWFNTEYSEEAVRQRREAVDADRSADHSHRWSAMQICGTELGKPAEVWRLSAALIDLFHIDPRWGKIEGWSDRDTERLEAAKVVLLVALVIDRDVHEYLGDKIDLATLPKGQIGEQLGRGFASINAGFDDGEGRWPEIVEGAVDVLRPKLSLEANDDEESKDEGRIAQVITKVPAEMLRKDASPDQETKREFAVLREGDEASGITEGTADPAECACGESEAANKEMNAEQPTSPPLHDGAYVIDEHDLALLEFLNRIPNMRRKISDVLPDNGPQDRKAVASRLRKLADRTPPLVDFPKGGRTGVAILPAGVEALRRATAPTPH